MTRVLKRPMFRLGGPANEGITSGLAPRLGYADGKTFEERMEERQALYDKYAPTRGRGDLSQFLIDFGLNVASAEPTGSILSTAAAEAKDPYARYTARKEARLSDEDKFTTAMIGDIYEQRKKTEREGISAQGDKQYAALAEDQLLATLLNKKSGLQKEIDQLRKVEDTGGVHPPRPIDQDRIDRLQTELDNLDVRIRDRTGGDTAWDKIPDDIKMAIYDEVEAEMPNASTQEILQEVIRRISKMKFATGGRVGYATAGQVIPGEMPRTSQADTIQSMSFEDLRSRLPSTITNDVIQLLANSQEALVEFSNIQTESDIRSFNRKYEVNLVLPAEA